jgi:hypothetical protein
MFGFKNAPVPAREKGGLDDILARHSANLAAERKAPERSDQPLPTLMKKVAFGKRPSFGGG